MTSNGEDDLYKLDLAKLDDALAKECLVELIESLSRRAEYPSDEDFQEELELLRRRCLRKTLTIPFRVRPVLNAFVHVIVDLARQGWFFHIIGADVFYRRPRTDEDRGQRDRRRSQLRAQHDEQLRQASVRTFIKEAERPRFFRGTPVSVMSLLRDGRELADALRQVMLSREPQAKFEQVVKPYIQVIDGEERCSQTDLRLVDIWRYFRHTWSNPYRSIPGRSMLYLIRDAATSHHCVIGIGALSSAPVKLLARDLYIGWEPEVVIEQLCKQPDRRHASWPLRLTETLLAELYVGDFLEQDLFQVSDLKDPPKSLSRALRQKAREERTSHHRLMRASDYKRRKRHMEDEGYWENQARTPLFKSKRLLELATLLSIRVTLQEAFAHGVTGGAVARLVSTTKGRKCVSDLVRRAKSRFVGTAIAELSVCGAIPPYSSILAGKLVAMLSISPSLIRSYEERYRNAVSVIASSMAGRPVVRPSKLVFIGTTSLYGVRPNQYDRITVPSDIVGGPTGQPLRYKYLAATKGWGTFQFCTDTSEALFKYYSSSKNGLRVNYIFGEGANPRLRALRDGLIELGFDDDEILFHGMEKPIYGVPLIQNLAGYLLGFQQRPKYLFSKSKDSTDVSKITQWWFHRWASKRLQVPHADKTFRDMSSHTLTRPIRHGGRVILPPEDVAQTNLFL